MNSIIISFICFLIVTSAFGFVDGTSNSSLSHKTMALIGFFASVYCLAEGVSLLGIWSDPLSGLEQGQRNQFSTKQGGRGGLLMLLFSIWPYLITAFGAFGAFIYGKGFIQKIINSDLNKN